VKAAELPRVPSEAERMAAMAEQQLKDLNESMRGHDSMPAWSSELGRVIQSDEQEHPRHQYTREKSPDVGNLVRREL
jgi:hypothetical protein